MVVDTKYNTLAAGSSVSGAEVWYVISDGLEQHLGG